MEVVLNIHPWPQVLPYVQAAGWREPAASLLAAVTRKNTVFPTLAAGSQAGRWRNKCNAPHELCREKSLLHPDRWHFSAQWTSSPTNAVICMQICRVSTQPIKKSPKECVLLLIVSLQAERFCRFWRALGTSLNNTKALQLTERIALWVLLHYSDSYLISLDLNRVLKL